MAKISFIVSAYNVEKYISDCINSIIAQTENDIEIIIVDDGSVDTTPQLCDNFAKSDSRITVIHKENGGLSSARLAGFKAALGKYIIFVDGDDYIENTMAEKLHRSAEEYNSDIVLCGYYTNSSNSQTEHLLELNTPVISGRSEIVEKYIQPFIGSKKSGVNLPRFLCFKLLKRELIQCDYFKHEDIFFSEDIVFNLLYTDNADVISIVNEPLYHYRNISNSLSNKYRMNKWQMYLNLFEFLYEYSKKRNIEIDTERMDDTIATAIFTSIDNAVISGKLRIYLSEIVKLRCDSTVKKYLKKKNNKSDFSVRLSLMLFKFKLYLILYFIRNLRLAAASRI